MCSNCSCSLEAIDIRKENGIILLEVNGRSIEINCPKCGCSKTSYIDGGIDWD